jgi:hypothetical protein
VEIADTIACIGIGIFEDAAAIPIVRGEDRHVQAVIFQQGFSLRRLKDTLNTFFQLSSTACDHACTPL